MNKFSKIATALAIAAVLLPAAAFAHGNDTEKGDDRGSQGFLGWEIFMHNKTESQTGIVTLVGTTSFDMKTSDNTTFTVQTGSAILAHPFNPTPITLADIKVGDKTEVRGSVSGNQISAKRVLDMPANTHPAKARGTVTAVNGNALTLQTNNHGVISNVTVNTDSNTTVTKADGTAGTTANVTVGSTVKVKGLWNEILNTLKAIKIHLF